MGVLFVVVLAVTGENKCRSLSLDLKKFYKSFLTKLGSFLSEIEQFESHAYFKIVSNVLYLKETKAY